MGKILLSCVLLTALGGILFGVVAHQASRFWFARPAPDAATYEVTIDEGDHLRVIDDDLRAHGVNIFWFRVYGRLSGNDGSDALPGTHALAEGMSYGAIFAALREGHGVEVTLTIPEGYTVAQIGARVTAAFPHITAEEWRTAAGGFSPLETHPFVVAAQKPDAVDLEGYLFPDTYQFFEDATAGEIATTMIDTMEARVQTVGLWDDVGEGKAFASVHDALTLASIIEREVREPETMAMVADIFLKRLALGMALQADSTVNYVTGGNDPSVSLADTAVDSPYNTYKYPGLPPGAISNPGMNALAAVATPATNPYYYFLTTDDGDVYYATTHDEHVAHKARYLR